ncbi:SDR family NAD(P)-dependent oxidoreductase, partial [Stenotrophomonas sp. GbtcB23]|uniref:SDR family NAD(P)-dependent oxidoreductase n=1 Tax=Stenotrophomonas sp. GbtcB23 TaxID=2824768 RepID=UPI001C30368C
MGRLQGKVAIVTGAAQGMGAPQVRSRVAEGAKVVFTDTNAEGGQALASELGESVRFVQQDVTSWDAWQNVVAEAEAVFGNVSILVNNAGILGPIAKTADISEADFLKVCA